MSQQATIAGGQSIGTQASRVPQITVVGHILNERVIFPDRVLYPVLGSPAAYSSLCLASLGVRVGLVTKHGPDFPADLLKPFDEAGIDQRGFTTCGASSDNELIYHPSGYKQIKFLAKADPITYADVPANYLSAPLVYICPMDGEVDVEMIARLREHQRCMVVDLGGFGGATSAVHPADKNGAALAPLCPLFDVVKGSIEDIEYILGMSTGDYKAAAAALHGWGAREVVITRGKEGVYVSKDGTARTIPAYFTDASKVIDQTGAGDCFSAGFLCSYLKHRDPFVAAAYGNVVTSFVIARTGGASVKRMPRRDEADQRAREFAARSGVAVAAA